MIYELLECAAATSSARNGFRLEVIRGTNSWAGGQLYFAAQPCPA
jgi:hypothetical protein